jgi:tetratricopeptide (TPR) repeat protein
MTYPAAYAAFETATELDEGCAMGYWGMGMTLFQPLWPTRPSDRDLEQGWELMKTARDESGGAERERAFIRTGEAFFNPEGSPDYWTRIQRWADASAELHETYPADREAQALHALSLLATASLHGDPAGHHARAASMLAEILAEEPTHPGAVHYTIHANDFAGRADRTLEVVRSYGDIAPENPHALHMPTHIFVRLGFWDEVVEGNIRAAEAALAQTAGPNGEYVWDEFPHAIGYLTYAYLQQADDDAAAESIRRLRAVPNLQPTFKTAFHVAATASRYALERKAWKEAATLASRPSDRLQWDRFPWPEAILVFARGLGATHTGDLEAAEQRITRLSDLVEGAQRSGEAVFVAPIEIMLLELRAWYEKESGNPERALELMSEAVELEEKTPKHPVSPGAILPAKELLGDLYLSLNEPAGALVAYREANAEVPGRFNTILGLARSHAALGDTETAEPFYARLLAIAPADSDRAGIIEARKRVLGNEGS